MSEQEKQRPIGGMFTGPSRLIRVEAAENVTVEARVHDRPTECKCGEIEGVFHFEMTISASDFCKPSLLMPCEDVRYGRAHGDVSLHGN